MPATDDRQRPPLVVAGERIATDPDGNRSRFAPLHRDAARLDGIVKTVVGLLLGGVSLALALAGIVAIALFVRQHVVSWWALGLGSLGLIGGVAGLVLVVWGFGKALSGRGDG
jgi:hypothetical protein